MSKSVKPMIAKILAIIPFNLVEFLGKGCKIDEEDERAKVLAEVDISKLIFETCLQEGGSQITGEEKLRRLKADGRIRLGAEWFLALWQNYQDKGANSLLENLYRTKGIRCLVFFGTILCGPGGRRYVLCLYRRGCDDWDWSRFEVGNDWISPAPAVLFAS